MNLSQKQLFLLISAAIVITTLIAYEPVRHNGFVSLDDTAYITENTHIKQGVTPESVIWAFTKPHFFMWHPLTTISHMLDCQIFGLNPFGHHFVSVVFHIINALILFWIINNLSGTIWLSAFIAGVFALHPTQVESVAWASERKTVLSSLFWLLTIAAYIRYAKQPRIGRYLLVLLVFILAVLAKPTVVTLPLALLLLDYWPLERVRWGHIANITSQAAQNRKSAVWLIAEKLPLLMLSAILSVLTVIMQRSGEVVVSLDKIPLGQRIANMFVSYISYIYKMIWPSKLAVYYPHPRGTIPEITVIICALLFILTLVLCIYTSRRKKYIAVGWLWYVGTLVPVIGLVQSGTQAMANRYMYIPILGLLIIIGWGIKDLIVSRPRLKTAATITGAAVLFLLFLLTRMQVKHWQNSITLFEYALKTTQNNDLAENSYGCALYEAGQTTEALLHISKAVEINPAYHKARYNLGKIYLREGKANNAVVCFKTVIEKNNASAEIYANLGAALGILKKYDEAITYLKKGIELEPDNPDIHNIMGKVLAATDKPNEAITHYKLALQASTTPAGIYSNIGSAYIQLGKFDLAAQNLTKAIDLKLDNVAAINKLAWLLAAVDDTSIHDAQKAVKLAQRSCELTSYNDPMLLDTLAVSYAAAGRFEEAKTTAEKALSIAKAREQEKLAIEIENRIKLYEAGQPYRQK